jgi:hypothetical protein
MSMIFHAWRWILEPTNEGNRFKHSHPVAPYYDRGLFLFLILVVSGVLQ